MGSSVKCTPCRLRATRFDISLVVMRSLFSTIRPLMKSPSWRGIDGWCQEESVSRPTDSFVENIFAMC